MTSEGFLTRNIEEVLILNAITPSSSQGDYLVIYHKKLQIASVDAKCSQNIKKIGAGTILTARRVRESRGKDHIRIEGVLKTETLSEQSSSPYTSISISNLPSGPLTIECTALTTGCFSFNGVDYSISCAYNNLLGILTDNIENPQIPNREIGRLLCLVSPKLVNSHWELRIQELIKFEPVSAIGAFTAPSDSEHYGLVTRVEGDATRDLRLISSRDFPRDVRLFRNGYHSCESQPTRRARASSKPKIAEIVPCTFLNSESLPAELLGLSVTFGVKRCRGVGLHGTSEAKNDADRIAHSNGVLGYHVDGDKIRRADRQTNVHVQMGFVEVETLCEYTGFTDHEGTPLLWSHDLEFIVDSGRVFENKPFGLYVVNAVRFHRAQIFAKWRLARRSSIVRSVGKTCGERTSHSITLASLGVGNTTSTRTQLHQIPNVYHLNGQKDIPQEFKELLDEPNMKPSVDTSSKMQVRQSEYPKRRTVSLSSASFDRTELFGALVANFTGMPSGSYISNEAAFPVHEVDEVETLAEGLEASMTLEDNDGAADDEMWSHHKTLAEWIVNENPTDSDMSENADIGTFKGSKI